MHVFENGRDQLAIVVLQKLSTSLTVIGCNMSWFRIAKYCNGGWVDLQNLKNFQVNFVNIMV